ncbi:MAG: patatin-like phospholipase family protein [Planctomycetota bacterium]
MPDEPSSQREPFRIALVMAGAVSAGAYQAGVIDGLLQALDEFYEAKAAEHPDAQHDVEISVISGASAGGMTAALLASVVRRKVAPVKVAKQPGTTANVFHHAWVERISIEHLLEQNDLEKESRVLSLLDCTVLDEIAEEVIGETESIPRRPYFGDDLKLLMSVSNLRGMPYAIDFTSADTDKPSDPNDRRDTHGMLLHKDHVGYRVDPPTPANDSNDELVYHALPGDDMKADIWRNLRNGALASGAFPVALKSRAVGRDRSEYDNRRFSIPARSPGVCERAEKIPPTLPDDTPDHLGFSAVDGGLANNEPLELARETLLGVGVPSHDDWLHATSAVIMIDPFPEPPTFDPHESVRTDIWSVLSRLPRVLINQSRFKLDELRMATGPNCNRFLISPSRDVPPDITKPGITPPHSACAALGSFGGFLHRRFREHDYELGRHNVRSFLMKHFTLCEHAELFGGVPGGVHEVSDNQRPIIPLLGSFAHSNDKEPDWPTLPAAEARNVLRLEDKLAARLKRVIPRLIDELAIPDPVTKQPTAGFWVRQFLRQGWFWGRGKATKQITAKIKQTLLDYNLAKPF